MIGVITQEIGDFYGSPIVNGMEGYLRQKNYFFLTVTVRDDPKLLETYSHLLADRGVEGLISADTEIDPPLPPPAIAIPGHPRERGHQYWLDHRKAACLALSHLVELSRKEIAFMNGWTKVQTRRIVGTQSAKLGIPMRAELIVQLTSRDATTQLGYPFAGHLPSRKRPLTACLP